MLVSVAFETLNELFMFLLFALGTKSSKSKVGVVQYSVECVSISMQRDYRHEYKRSRASAAKYIFARGLAIVPICSMQQEVSTWPSG